MLKTIRHSIQLKVMSIIVVTTFITLLAAAIALVVYDLRAHQALWISDLQTQADIVGSASAPALAFQDSLTAHQNLALLAARPQIQAAAIYGEQGQRFASYARPGSREPFPLAQPGDGSRMASNRLVLARAIADKDERLGTLYLVADYDVRGRLVGYLGLVAFLMLLGLTVAVLLSYRLQVAVTRPILAIADTARRVEQSRDFSLRVAKTTEDETGSLVDSFNDMLEEIGERAHALETEMKVRQEAENALRIANQRKDEFLATLAHELRNPLGPVRNAVHYLRLNSAPASEVQRPLEIIDRQVQQMARLIEDLLDISRITRGTLDLRLSLFPLEDLMRDVIESCQHALDEAGHAFDMHGPAMGVTLHADRARLTQAICNLVNNATKYTPPGGTVRLDVRVDGHRLDIDVEDSGIGIPSDKLNDIFEPFSQLDRSLEKTRGGLGIGLALARRLVGLHGGTVTAESNGPGEGSTFHVSMPVVAELSAAPPAMPRAELPRAQGSRRILVADDNPDAAQSLALLLRAVGYEVATASDGLEAFECAARARFDAMLLDIGMPKLNGYDLARKIRGEAWGQGIVLVALTGWGQLEDKQMAFDSGFDDHLTKPIQPEELLALLARNGASTPG
jgi:signal transduction histidine kinase/CheY-like chemotaxis protein